MLFEIVTPASTQPISVDDLKTQLAITIHEFDAYLYGLILTSTALCETYLNGSIITTAKRFFTSSLCNPIRIPHGSIQAATAVEYRTEDGTWNTLSTSVWDFAVVYGQGNIFLKPSQSYPAVSLYPVHPVRISFTSGFGASSDDIPEVVKHAVKMTAGYLFDHREDGARSMPDAARHLLSNHRCVTQEMF